MKRQTLIISLVGLSLCLMVIGLGPEKMVEAQVDSESIQYASGNSNEALTISKGNSPYSTNNNIELISQFGGIARIVG